MSFIKTRPGESFFNPVTDNPSVTKIQLADGSAFGNDKFLEDVDLTTPPVSKFDDGGAGYKAVVDGNRLGLPAYKKTVIVYGFWSKNVTGATLSKVAHDGTVSAVSTFPARILAGEDLQFAGTASDPDNYVGVSLSEEKGEEL